MVSLCLQNWRFCVCMLIVCALLPFLVWLELYATCDYGRLLHIPKTGGQALSLELGYAGIISTGPANVICGPLGLGGIPPEYVGQKIQHMPPRWLHPHTSGETYCVVRDPYDRTLSEIRYRYKDLLTHNELLCTVEHLSELVTSNIDKTRNHLDHQHYHWLPQHYYLLNEKGERTCTHILCLENVGESLAGVAAEIAPSSLFWRLAVATPIRYVTNIIWIKQWIKKDPSNQTKKYVCPNMTADNFLTDGARAIVERFYWADFALLNYPTPNPINATHHLLANCSERTPGPSPPSRVPEHLFDMAVCTAVTAGLLLLYRRNKQTHRYVASQRDL